MRRSIPPVCLLSLFVAACATTSSDPGMLTVETASNGAAVEGATCAVTTSAGNWTVTTPGQVQVGAPSGELRIVCDKPGYRTSQYEYRNDYGTGGSGVGVGLGGGSGGVGFGLSFPIGGRPAGSYPSRIVVEMNPV